MHKNFLTHNFFLKKRYFVIALNYLSKKIFLKHTFTFFLNNEYLQLVKMLVKIDHYTYFYNNLQLNEGLSISLG